MAIPFSLIGLAFGYYRLILDWEGRPFCHKQIGLGFLQFTHESGGHIVSYPKPFPNVKGLSQDSLASIREVMGYMDWVRDYNYVPGLREDDPGDLVLMYVNRPTRWTWHGQPPTIFKEKQWIIVPVDFTWGMRPRSGPGELSERVSFSEFRGRLRRTLDFVRINERPNWQAVVSEHKKFLDSIEHGDR